MSDPFIHYGRQSIDDNDVDAVLAALRSDNLTQGPRIEQFEAALTDLTGAAHVAAVSNATAALHIACLALDVGPGDVVWTSPNSFVASANCAVYCGADVDFVDIDPATLNMSATALAGKLENARNAGETLPKVVIPVHFAGRSCDMSHIRSLAEEYGFRIIEDASHAIGGQYRNSAIGGCEYSDIAVFSFHPVKIITTAEGGAALTNDAALAERLTLLRSHGVTRADHLKVNRGEGGWHYDQIRLGYNYRMTDLQAALGASQLTRIGGFIDRRHEIAAIYDRELAGLPIRLCEAPTDGRSALHLYVIQVDDPAVRAHAYEALKAHRIGVNVHYIPIHLQPFYRARGFNPGDFPAAEDYYSRALSIPLHPSMESEDIDRVVAALRKVLT